MNKLIKAEDIIYNFTSFIYYIDYIFNIYNNILNMFYSKHVKRAPNNLSLICFPLN